MGKTKIHWLFLTATSTFLRSRFLFAGVVKLVDTLRSGRSPRKGVEVQVLSPAPMKERRNFERRFLLPL